MSGSENTAIRAEIAEMKQLLARALGEIYRLQQRLDISVPVSDGVVYGLLNGVERAVQEVLNDDPLTKQDSDAAEQFLQQIYNDEKKLAALQGFYDIERELEAMGIDRGKAIALLTYLHNNNQFGEITEKMNSSHSPIEVKSFELTEFEHGYPRGDKP